MVMMRRMQLVLNEIFASGRSHYLALMVVVKLFYEATLASSRKTGTTSFFIYVLLGHVCPLSCPGQTWSVYDATTIGIRSIGASDVSY